MVEVVARLLLAAILVFAAGLKLTQPRRSAAAMAVYGARSVPAQWALWASAIAAELALALGVAAGVETAAYLAAAMMLLFALLMVGAILAGRAGASCACFGAESRLGWTAVARNIVLAAAFIGLTLLPRDEISTEQWLALGLIACIAGLVALSVAVLALAREVGMLRLRLPPGTTSALEIPEEGPPLGQRVEWAEWGGGRGDGLGADSEAGLRRPNGTRAAMDLRLAVFLSESCHICRELKPQVRSFARGPLLSTELFDEVADAGAWRAFDVPGSPYAVACDGGGTALAKGTFNTVAQLESILAAAERRHAQAAAGSPPH